MRPAPQPARRVEIGSSPHLTATWLSCATRVVSCECRRTRVTIRRTGQRARFRDLRNRDLPVRWQCNCQLLKANGLQPLRCRRPLRHQRPSSTNMPRFGGMGHFPYEPLTDHGESATFRLPDMPDRPEGEAQAAICAITSVMSKGRLQDEFFRFYIYQVEEAFSSIP